MELRTMFGWLTIFFLLASGWFGAVGNAVQMIVSYIGFFACLIGFLMEE
jgi:hypothetical protein